VEHKSDRRFSYEITDNNQNIRLDTFLAARSIDLSRSKIQSLIKNGYVKVNMYPSKSSYRLRAGDHILVSFPHPSSQVLEPETVAFSVVHEDDSLIVVNKPAGVVVHPAPGHATGTLVHGLLQHGCKLSGIGGVLRPGIVHRLDKNTSGLIVAAKDDECHAFLAKQFKAGMVKKEYVALVHGRIKGEEGKIDLSVARHPKKRKQMAVTLSGGRRALTLWQKIEEYHRGFSLLLVTIKTGRTHQIRVHLSNMGHPVVGDPVYGPGRNWWKRHLLNKKALLPVINRQMLHARKLGFIHPVKGHYVEFEAAPPQDMERVVQALRRSDMH
jgi:23S rRNA pseudouridine1911/1915/1917 synthase